MSEYIKGCDCNPNKKYVEATEYEAVKAEFKYTVGLLEMAKNVRQKENKIIKANCDEYQLEIKQLKAKLEGNK